MNRRPSDSADGAVLRSQDIARVAGTTPRALRHYHKLGLLPEPDRDPNGYRRYSIDDLLRVLRIRQLAATGVPLRRIGAMLAEHAHIDAELLDELEHSLDKQAARIEEQRRTITRLRRQALAPHGTPRSPAVSGGMSVTEQTDRDAWALLVESGSIDNATAATVVDALRAHSSDERSLEWFAEFEGLESHEHIADDTADRLALRIVDFAEAMVAAAGITPATEELPILGMIEELQRQRLSQAQQQVWERVVRLTAARWASQSEDSSPATR